MEIVRDIPNSTFRPPPGTSNGSSGMVQRFQWKMPGLGATKFTAFGDMDSIVGGRQEDHAHTCGTYGGW